MGLKFFCKFRSKTSSVSNINLFLTYMNHSARLLCIFLRIKQIEIVKTVKILHQFSSIDIQIFLSAKK